MEAMLIWWLHCFGRVPQEVNHGCIGATSRLGSVCHCSAVSGHSSDHRYACGGQNQDEEVHLGQEVFNKLKAKVKSSNLPFCTPAETHCGRHHSSGAAPL